MKNNNKFAITILISATISSQCAFAALDDKCPEGFVLAGIDSVSHDRGQGNALRFLKVDVPLSRDRKYRQGNAVGRLVGTDDGGHQAQTPWNGQHSIRGVHIEVGGNYYYALGVDVNGEKGYPKTIAETDPETGESSSEQIQIGGYCGPGGNGQGCTATVKVCYKPKN